MDVTEIIQQIVGTYDLPPRLKQRIVRAIENNTRQKGITSFDEIYRYADYVIERFNSEAIRISKNTVSLEDGTSPNSELKFGEVLGQNDSSLTNLLKTDEAPANNNLFTIAEIVDLLRDHISEKGIGLLMQLQSKAFRTTPEQSLIEVEDRTFDIAKAVAKLEALVKHYERNGVILIPPRPILQVHFNPVYIRFGHRKYNGNPLAFFHEHKEHYSHIKTRHQLQVFDKGLHERLRLYGQLEETFPETDPALVEKGRKLGKREKQTEDTRLNEILSKYEDCEGNASKAARELGYKSTSHPPVLYHWKKAGLKAHGRGGTADEHRRIIEEYEPSGGNAAKAARNLGLTNWKVWTHWHKEGLKAKGRGNY